MRRALGGFVWLCIVLSSPLVCTELRAEDSVERPRPAPAPLDRHDAEAHALLSAGASALADGRFEDALDYFERSYKLCGKPEILYNIGLAHDRLRHDREAAHAFEAYLRLSADKQRRADARARLKVLKRALARTSNTSASRPAPAPESVEPKDAGVAPPATTGQRTVVAAPPPSTPIEESPLLRGL